MNYSALGFKAGLEIHQQLDTSKLFCRCPSELSDEINESFERFLRPTQSELGELDRAAIAEAKKRKRFLYYASRETCCLVEADEEPPHSMNLEALDIALTVSLLLNAKPVDEIHVMRKIVIDGSNTTGFQRTALVALDGKVKDIGIQTVALEEDAARKVSEKGRVVNYNLDRLGIPLIEVATAADLKSPKHAREVAEYIGSLFYATGKCKKGLGTIRQDLNVSIKGGARVEIKGIQYLSAIERVAEREVLRQLDLLKIKEELQKRGITENDIECCQPVDASDIFKNTKSKIVKKGIDEGKKIFVIKLPGFSGLLKREHSRLGKEFAIHAKLSAGLGGIIHSDELPGYGINEKEILQIRELIDAEEKDAFAMFIGKEESVNEGIKSVRERAIQALRGVPEEVRRALPDDSTEYMRPLPGAARMYPETDIPPVRITDEMLNRIKDRLPERPEERAKRMKSEYKLNDEQVSQIIRSGYADDFESLARRFKEFSSTIARTFLNTLPELEREGISLDGIDVTVLDNIFSALRKNRFAKEAIPEIVRYIAE
ncbi:MAG TPA: Glu-tRNA(Gln) amidotransferase subunit GatE, partial [Thermoplasmatales archaeon]|nr:Glu-tRNA(Gln) amidotransferase subunit GatE [Thermoplasmatales archaeon]